MRIDRSWLTRGAIALASLMLAAFIPAAIANNQVPHDPRDDTGALLVFVAGDRLVLTAPGEVVAAAVVNRMTCRRLLRVSSLSLGYDCTR